MQGRLGPSGLEAAGRPAGILAAAVCLSGTIGGWRAAVGQDAWVFATAIPCASAPVYGVPFNQCSVSNTRNFRIGSVRSWRLTFGDAKSEAAAGLYRIVAGQGSGGMSAVSRSGMIDWLRTAEASRA